MMNPSFWHGKRVMITGHTGFKGSWLSLWLQSLGAHVIGYALDPPTEPSLFDLASVGNGMVSVEGDVRDAQSLKRTVAKHEPEIIFHMAAQALVRESYRNPVDTYASNVMGTVNLLDAVRRSPGVRAVVCVTSDKCYENQEWIWGYREYEAVGGYDPYSSSKGCAEIVTSAYRNSFFNPTSYKDHGVAVASARAGNVIGGGDWATDRLIPDILRTLMTGRPLEIRNPLAVRPWQHVLEPLNGYLTLAERLYEVGPKFCGGWNFGPHESGVKPVSWVVDYLLSQWGEGVSWQQDASCQPHEDNFLILDCSKARHGLGWSPTLDLRTALCWIVDWVRAFQAGDDMRRVTEGQISDFTQLLFTGESHSKTDQQTRKTLEWQEHADLFDLVHETVMSRSADGTIAFWNLGAEEMYGWKKEEAIGRVSHILLKTEFPQPLEEIEAELERTGRWEGKLIHKRRDGQRIAVKSRWAVRGDNDKRNSSVLEINHSMVAQALHKLSLLMVGAVYCFYNMLNVCAV